MCDGVEQDPELNAHVWNVCHATFGMNTATYLEGRSRQCDTPVHHLTELPSAQIERTS